MDVSTELEHDATKKMFERLILDKDKSINHNDTIKRDIEGAKTFQEVFCCSDPLYKKQIEQIQKVKNKKVKNGTVAAFLHGCFESESSVEVSCTPACATGLRNPELKPCGIPSYEKKNGKLHKLNNIKGDEANVFLAHNEELTMKDKEKLHEQGIRTITVYDQLEDSIKYELNQSYATVQNNVVSDTTNNNLNGWFWIILLLIVISVSAYFMINLKI